MGKVFANSGDPDQTPRSAASDLGLRCLPITLLGASRLQWAKSPMSFFSHDQPLAPIKSKKKKKKKKKKNPLFFAAYLIF